MLKYSLFILIAFLGASIEAMENQNNGWIKFLGLINKALDPVEIKKLNSACDFVDAQRKKEQRNVGINYDLSLANNPLNEYQRISNLSLNNENSDMQYTNESIANGNDLTLLVDEPLLPLIDEISDISEINSNKVKISNNVENSVPVNRKRKRGKQINSRRNRLQEDKLAKERKRKEQIAEKQTKEYQLIIDRVIDNKPVENFEDLAILLKNDYEAKKSSIVKRINEFYTKK